MTRRRNPPPSGMRSPPFGISADLLDLTIDASNDAVRSGWTTLGNLLPNREDILLCIPCANDGKQSHLLRISFCIAPMGFRQHFFDVPRFVSPRF